jgi:UDP-N-acetylmuramate dehydrogenase
VTETWDPAAAARGLRETGFGEVKESLPLSRLTASRVGGPADVVLTVRTVEALAAAAGWLWQREYPFRMLGGGSNVLAADAGYRGVIVLNACRAMSQVEGAAGPSVVAESGANFGMLARRAAEQGLSGLEWAVSIPGTVGGAVVGNAGAYGGDVETSLELAEILHHSDGRRRWDSARLAYGYRSSWLKSHPGEAVVLGAGFRCQLASAEAVKARMAEFVAHRQRTQPPGASWGSTFKNPLGDSAGRLLDEAGLKGLRKGDAQISPVHANFILNLGEARAADVCQLVVEARKRVKAQLGVELELEVELIGAWDPGTLDSIAAGVAEA